MWKINFYFSITNNASYAIILHMQYLLVLGREPKLSLAELESLFGAQNIETLNLAKNKFFNQSIEQQRSIINRLLQKRVEGELRYATELGVIEQNAGIYSSTLIDYGQQLLRARNYM